MADYCTVAEVQAETPHVQLNPTTKPTTAQVTAWCGEITAEMDAHFSAVGITVPVTGAAQLLVVKPIAILGVRARIYAALETAGGGKAVDLNVMYRQRLKDITDNPAILAPSTMEPGAVGTFDAGLEETGEPGDEDYDNGRAFQRQSRQW